MEEVRLAGLGGLRGSLGRSETRDSWEAFQVEEGMVHSKAQNLQGHQGTSLRAEASVAPL